MALSLLHPVAWADFEQDLSATGDINNLPALRELRARAVAGDANAQLNMGGIFFKGQDVDQDYAEGAKWFHLAARQGNPHAQFNLGMMYDMGLGTAQNHTEAVRWYRLAADQGLALAQLNLGVAYATGQGILKNELDAAKWLRLAADQGEAQAQFNLGVMYANGQGVTQNFTEAYRWARLAALQGHEMANALALDLSKQISPEQQARNPGYTAQETFTQETSTQEASANSVSENSSAASTGSGDYYLQLAAFKSKKEAEKYLAKMLGQLGKIDKTFSIFKSDGWVRTQIGPYVSLNEARRSALSFKSRLGYEPLLKRH
jgi:TPR repeat protein